MSSAELFIPGAYKNEENEIESELNGAGNLLEGGKSFHPVAQESNDMNIEHPGHMLRQTRRALLRRLRPPQVSK